MEDTDIDILDEAPVKKWHFEWVLPTFFKPKSTLHQIVEQDRAVWLTPLVILSVLALASVLLSGPARISAVQMGATLPSDFQYYPPEMQQQFLDAQAQQSSPMMIYILPAIGAIAGVWLGWLLLGVILHLAYTVSGSGSRTMTILNLVGWASLPLGLRYMLQAGFSLITHSAVNGAGLSGLVSAEATGIAAVLGILLRFIDLFTVWQVILILLGAVPASGLGKTKAMIATLIALLIMLVLAALPGYIGSRIGGLSSGRGFFFF